MAQGLRRKGELGQDGRKKTRRPGRRKGGSVRPAGLAGGLVRIVRIRKERGHRHRLGWLRR
jgi:hypothetical protein